jgi:uncharacterized protein (DUF433 family)
MNNLITISPDIQSGTPVFSNTRVPVKNLFDYLIAGNDVNEFLKDFPSVKKQQVIALLKYLENTISFSVATDDKVIA